MDVLPTLLAMLGVAETEDIEGRSLAPLLAGHSESGERLARDGSVE